MEPLRELGKSWQREAKELRASTPAFLLPLSPEPMSRETVVIITSTLNTALEMDGARTVSYTHLGRTVLTLQADTPRQRSRPLYRR